MSTDGGWYDDSGPPVPKRKATAAEVPSNAEQISISASPCESPLPIGVDGYDVLDESQEYQMAAFDAKRAKIAELSVFQLAPQGAAAP